MARKFRWEGLHLGDRQRTEIEYHDRDVDPTYVPR
jgi:hypothetical protein